MHQDIRPITIAVNNQKGGVAKTTTCLSLGACLAEMGYSVLLIDLDPQAHLTMSLGIQPNDLHRTIGDALLGQASLVSVSRESAVFDLDIVPANQNLALINKILYQQKGYAFRLKQMLADLPEDFYEVIIIDGPPTVNTLTLNALTTANLLIIPIQCEYYATRSLNHILKLTKMVQSKTNPSLTYQLLITMFDRRNKICRLIYDRMQKSMGARLYQTIIEIDTKLKESPAFGQPITCYAPNTRAANQYRALAKELMQNGRKKT